MTERRTDTPARPAPEHFKVLVRSAREPRRGTVVCFPHAGAGANGFGRWRRHVPADVDLLVVRLPGRERLVHRPPVQSLEEAVDLVTADLLRLAEDGLGPTVFYGQCSGAILALEVARRSAGAGGPVPELLGLASQGYPIDDGGPPEPIDGAAERLFRRSFPESLGFDNRTVRELWALIGDAMRQDMVLTQGYRAPVDDPLPSALSAFVGAQDPELTPSQVEPWSGVVTGAFRRHVLPAGHLLGGVEGMIMDHLLADWRDAGRRATGPVPDGSRA